MIEVLVAVLVLSIGLLGLAGLQANSLQNSQSAANSSSATFLAADVLDKIRANRGNAMGYAITIDAEPPLGNDIASSDLRAWKQNIDSHLTGSANDPDFGGSIQVIRTAGTAGDFFEVVVTLRWVASRWEEEPGERIREFIVRTEI